MSYVSRTLGSKERILYATGYHWLYWLGTAVVCAPFVGVLLGGFPAYGVLEIVALAVTALPFLWGINLALQGVALEVAVTTDRFVKKTGFFAITSEEVSLDKIEEVNVSESLIGRVFNYGDVEVHGTGAGSIDVHMVNDPVRLRREVQTAREQLKTKGE
jgi:uncharacterized membrane protein YdbT with pleckstrin-like domain